MKAATTMAASPTPKGNNVKSSSAIYKLSVIDIAWRNYELSRVQQIKIGIDSSSESSSAAYLRVLTPRIEVLM
jgi:hypothetical protein